jgi:hypothetical protein
MVLLHTMNPGMPQAKPRAKATTAYVYLAAVELENLSKNATQIEVRADDKPLGRLFIARTGIEFRGPHQKKRGVQKSWNELIDWLSSDSN